MLGALSAVFGVANAVGGFMGASAQTAATNRDRLMQWEMQQSEYLNKGFDAYSRYNMKKAQYSSQLTNNLEAYGDTVFAGDRRIDQASRAKLYADQSAMIQARQNTGTIEATGGQGVSAGRLRGAVLSDFGRNQQLAAENLISQKQDVMINRQSAYRSMLDANEQAYADVYISPKAGQPPVQPTMQPGPNPLTLIGGIGNSLIGGYQLHQSMQPPGQT